MLPIQPSAQQYRAAAAALVIVAALTVIVIAVARVDILDGPLLLPSSWHIRCSTPVLYSRR